MVRLADGFQYGESEADARGVFVLVMDVKIGADGGQRDAQDERGLEHAEAVTGAVTGAGEVVAVALHGAQGVVGVAGDFLRFLALQPEADGHALVGEGGADVLLLAAGGDVDVEFFEGLDVAPDGAGVAAEELRQILLGEQAALLPSVSFVI